MADKQAAIAGPSSDDRLLVVLAYLFSPLFPIIILFLDDKKDVPFIRENNAQALIFGLINIVVGIITAISSIFIIGIFCCAPFSFILFVYWIYLIVKAFQGETVEIPVITNFVRNQGWD